MLTFNLKTTTDMKNIKFIALALLGLTYSCDVDEFLNPDPESLVTNSTFFNTDSDVEQGILGVYDAIQGIPEETTGSVITTNKGVQFEYLLTEHRSDNTRSATIEGSKADFHRYIVEPTNNESTDYYQSMYEVIFRANNILQYVGVADEANQTIYTAELRFLRAYAYFNLVRLYGDVPLALGVVSPDNSEALYTRVASADIYDVIVTDLEYAAANMVAATTKNRASQPAAQGLLAKAYLSLPTPNYTGARQMCEAIVNSGVYTLEADYNDVFYNETGNDEVIFSIGYIAGVDNDSQGFSSEFDSDAGRQDGLNIPNDNLVNAFTGDAGTVRSDFSYRVSLNDLELYEVGKYFPDGVSDGDFSDIIPRNAGNDWIVLRYADILLLHVEAIMAGANTTTDGAALASFNAIRERAVGAEDDYALITQDDLLLERRLELAFENQRFFDLQRFGLAAQVLQDHATEMGYTFSTTDLLLPIPQSEINLSNGLLTQNPGY